MTPNSRIEQTESFSSGSSSSFDHIEDILGPLSKSKSTTTAVNENNNGKMTAPSSNHGSAATSSSSTNSTTTKTNTARARDFLKNEVPYHDMLSMTMELAQDIYLNLRKDDRVMINMFGYGTVIKVPRKMKQSNFSLEEQYHQQQHRHDNNNTSSKSNSDEEVSLSSLVIKLDFGGTLYLRNGQEFVHKCLSTMKYDEVMDHLEQIRKLQLAATCQDWNISIPKECDCVACVFNKPELSPSLLPSSISPTSASSASSAATIATPTSTSNGPRGWAARLRLGGRSRSSSPTNNDKNDGSNTGIDTTSNNISNSTTAKQQQQEQESPSNVRQTSQRCDVCGNPVCPYHKLPSLGGHEYFCMCVDCQHDLTQAEHHFKATKLRKKSKKGGSKSNDNSNPLPSYHSSDWWVQWHKNLQRLVLYYTRMSVQLTMVVPILHELAEQLTSRQKIDSRISIGNSALGFVGAALGVAGAATMLTPAGPAILLAAVATSATSGTLQFSHQSYNKYLSKKEAHHLADKVLGWHGLCLGILNGLEQLRIDLLSEVFANNTKLRESVVRMSSATSVDSNNNNNNNNQQSLNESSNDVNDDDDDDGDNNNNSSEIWNTLAVGSFTTTRQAMTLTGTTAAFGASASQAVTTSLQAVPVIGGIFSVGCMAMDAANIQASLKQLQTPSQKGEALIGIQNIFTKGGNSSATTGGTKLPNHIEAHVELIQTAMDQLHHSLLLDGDYVELHEEEDSESEEDGNETEDVEKDQQEEVISIE